MLPTERFYQADAYRTEAPALIAAVQPLEGGGGLVAMTGTVFIPRGAASPPTGAP